MGNPVTSENSGCVVYSFPNFRSDNVEDFVQSLKKTQPKERKKVVTLGLIVDGELVKRCVYSDGIKRLEVRYDEKNRPVVLSRSEKTVDLLMQVLSGYTFQRTPEHDTTRFKCYRIERGQPLEFDY